MKSKTWKWMKIVIFLLWSFYIQDYNIDFYFNVINKIEELPEMLEGLF